MRSKPSEHDKIIAEAREKYTVHNCEQCEFRKSCINEFDSDECKKLRQSIMLGFGIEDGYFTKLLDRLEAAHKREIEATAAKCCQLGRLAGYGASEIKHQQETVGNAAKMREALVKIKECYDNDYLSLDYDSGDVLGNAALLAENALAAPPRNCDVGTAEEQYKKHCKWCKKMRDYSCAQSMCSECYAKWSQMPYEEGETK